MFAKTSLTVYLLIVAIVCISGAPPQLDGRIVGGFEVNIEQVPWQVSLLNRGSQHCGGSIISASWILTAAHCTYRKTVRELSVRAGSSKYNRNGQLYDIKRIVQHPLYNRGITDYDYSLLELTQRIQFDQTKQAIPLSNANERASTGTSCLVTGWGSTQDSSIGRNQLRGTELPIISEEKCNLAYKAHARITDRMICAGFDKGGKDACQGDSGGPLVCDDKLYGVVSWGYGCAKPNFPGVYASVSNQRAWIRQNTGI